MMTRAAEKRAGARPQRKRPRTTPTGQQDGTTEREEESSEGTQGDNVNAKSARRATKLAADVLQALQPLFDQQFHKMAEAIAKATAQLTRELAQAKQELAEARG
ncbi:hypothetical protein F5883DRAFT_651553 [Diaporthe sp. PMI_573]|nr:hypothetical protein F5883DRAFT_651553 [Diaporthaceae sp. PMI_573]